MHGRRLVKLLTLLLLIGISHAGLVHRRAIKETQTLTDVVEKVSKSALTPPRFDQIPVTIIQDPQQDLTLIASAPVAEPASKPDLEPAPQPESEPTKLPLESVGQQQAEVQQQDQASNTQLDVTERLDVPAEGLTETETETENSIGIKQSEVVATDSVAAESIQSESTSQAEVSDNQPEILIPEASVSLEATNNVKALPPAVIAVEPQTPVVVAPENIAPEVLSPQQDDLQRQVTQPTPTQTSTPQNFVQQLIQNSPIGQFLSQFTGGQQQQQQQQQPGQTLADEPATPAPTLPGFLNPAAAITSAQQAVQNAAQSVVNTTTQAFQGLQQFATNLGTQFQNTFSTLAGQQNQLSTADSTTTRPPGPIQSIVSSFVNPANNQGTEGSTAAPGQQGPLQGILSFFQGGNRPQTSNAVSTAPPKEEPVTPSGIDDKIESEQNDPVVDALPDQQEPDTANEVRNSAEVTSEDNSFEEAASEDLIVVNDDANQQDVTA